MSAFDDFLTGAVNDSINTRPYDQDLDDVLACVVDAREAAHEELRDVTNPPSDVFVRGLDGAIRVLWIAFALLALAMLAFNASVFN